VCAFAKGTAQGFEAAADEEGKEEVGNSASKGASVTVDGTEVKTPETEGDPSDNSAWEGGISGRGARRCV